MTDRADEEWEYWPCGEYSACELWKARAEAAEAAHEDCEWKIQNRYDAYWEYRARAEAAEAERDVLKWENDVATDYETASADESLADRLDAEGNWGYWQELHYQASTRAEAAEAKLRHAVLDLMAAEERLAAVLALCDSDRYGDQGSMFAHDVRAAATGGSA